MITKVKHPKYSNILKIHHFFIKNHKLKTFREISCHYLSVRRRGVQNCFFFLSFHTRALRTSSCAFGTLALKLGLRPRWRSELLISKFDY